MSDQQPPATGGQPSGTPPDQPPSLWQPVPPAPPGGSPYAAPSYGPGYAVPPAYAATPPAYAAPPPPSTNGFAVAALICGLLAFLTGITAVLGIIFGLVALSQIKKTGQQGRGMAIAGLVISIVILVISIVAIVLVVALTGWIINTATRIDEEHRADLVQAAAAQERYADMYGSYATRFDQLESVGYSPGSVYSTEIVYATETYFCMESTSGHNWMYVTQTATPTWGHCPAEPA
ncbi:MAG: DUF4190 domain-containing protein [Candidatus Nanopelagicales bacterium]